MQNWYVVYTKPKQELVACLHLNNQGFEVFFPTCRKEKIRAGKCIEISEALFPRYLFIKPKSEQMSFSSVRYTKGVTDFVRFGGQIATLPDETITELNTYQQNLVMPVFTCGDIIQINDGPFAGLSAVFRLHQSEKRCEVLLEWLGRASLVSMPVRHIIKAE